MQAKPFISVIIPAFRPAGFVDLRASMECNADVPTEWIVVDDGSGPDFAEVFATLKAYNLRVLVLSENRGQAGARNAGLAGARGEWVKFLDADDRLDAEHLRRLLDAVGTPGDPLPFASTYHVHAEGRRVENNSWNGLAESSDAQLERMIKAPFMSHCGPIYPRSMLERIGAYDETLITDEDGDLLLRLLLEGVRFRAVPGVHYFYQHHDRPGRVSYDESPDKIAARLRVCEKLEAALGGKLSVQLARALAHRMDRIALSTWRRDRTLSRRIVAKAELLAPGHRAELRWPLRLAWCLGGPAAVLAMQQWMRRLRRGGSGK